METRFCPRHKLLYRISREIVGLLGPNGAGKTTAFYVAAGLVFSEVMERYLSDDQDVTNDPMHARARQLGLAYLPQEASLFSDLTVWNKNLLGIAELIWQELLTTANFVR